MRNGNSGGWLRSSVVKVLLAGALTVSLVLGAFTLWINSRGPAAAGLDRPAVPLTDDQSRAQVVGSARQLVTLADLPRATGGYTLLSCKNENEPPYQGAADIHFELPSNAVGYFEKFAATLLAHGWQEGLPPNHRVVGKTLSKDGVTAIAYRDNDIRRLGIMKIYGECRNITNHRIDTAAWTDITDQLGRAPH